MVIEISGNARAVDAKPLVHFWSACVGAGRANEGLRANWLEQLQCVRDHCGFRYVRFHGLFHDDMFVYRRDEQGRAIYNFQYVDELFDRLLAIDVRPFVEFGFSPGDLASERGTVFWWKGHGSPPTDYGQWTELIERIVRHWIARYGLAEVRRWYFEVWNEPNLHPFFKGTRSQYFQLYKATALAVKRVGGQLRVGGPATSNFVPDARFDGETEDLNQHAVVVGATDIDALDWRPVWLAEFCSYCKREALPLDFVSCHPYPTDWALDAHGETVKQTRGAGATSQDLALLRRMVDAGPFPKAEIHLTEWSSSPSPRDHTHDYLQAATFVVKVNIESIGLVDSLSYWTFTDIFEEGGAGDTPFHGGFGMLSHHGVTKPTFHAYRFLHALGDQLVALRPGAIVTRHHSSKRVTALAYHYPAEVSKSAPASFESRDVADATLAMGTSATLTIELSGLRPGASIVMETLDEAHGNVISAWRSMGEPRHTTREQEQALRTAGAATGKNTFTADAQGRFTLHRQLSPWSIVLLQEL